MNVLSLETNLSSLALQKMLSNSLNKLNKSIQNLATGFKINSAADNAASYQVSQNMETQISGIKVGSSNINNTISALNAKNNYTQEVTTILDKIKDLTLQASNGTYTDEDRKYINTNAIKLADSLNSLITKSNYQVQDEFKLAMFPNHVNTVTKTEALSQGYDENHIINSALEFQTKINADLTGNFIIVNNLDMSELGTLTSSAIFKFGGNLDGNGYIVENLTIDTNSSGLNQIGLFAWLENNAEVKNLGIKNVEITAIGSARVGGLVGWSTNSKIENCFVMGSVEGGGDVGLFAGSASAGSIIQDAFATGNSISNGKCGGFVANINASQVLNAHAEVSVQGSFWDTGGFAANVTNSTVGNVSSTGNVVGNNAVGGLIGSIINSNISDSFSTGNVQGASEVGGFCGAVAGSTITDSYATGDTTGGGRVGGFTGQFTNPTMTNTYSTGKVSGSGNIGGFAGYKVSGSIGATNYWDTETSGLATSAGPAQGVDSNELGGIKDSRIWDNIGYEEKGGCIIVQAGGNIRDAYVIDGIALNIDLSGLDLSTQTKAENSAKIIDHALSQMQPVATHIGIGINKLDSLSSLNNTNLISLTSAHSTIKDSDVATDTSEVIKQQILKDTTVALITQTQSSRSQILLKLIPAA